MRFARLLIAVLLVTLPTAARAQMLGVSGDHFTVNGAPKYLLFVSYFDAMRRANSGGGNTGDLDADFAYLKSKGIDGIRIFPNWWVYSCGGNTQDNQTLFLSNGSINGSMLNVFKRILQRAASHELLVDVSFTRETYNNNNRIPFPQYKNAIVQVAGELAAGHTHVFFDIQNEIQNDTPDVLQPGEAGEIVAAVHARDPNRIATASVGDGVLERTQNMDVVTYHRIQNPGDPNWYTAATVSAAITSRKNGMAPTTKPIYAQEPKPFRPAATCPSDQEHDAVDSHHRSAAAHHKLYGGAAYTFHTRQSFHMASSRLVDALNADPAQKATLESLRAEVDATSWGIAPPSPPPPPPVNHMDINGDGYSDLVWQQRSSTGQLVAWFMNGLNRIGASLYSPGAVVPLAWEIRGSGDFNQDGKTDLLWRHNQTGEVLVWYMDGTTMFAHAFLPTVSILSWDIVGVSDVNRDGDPDIVWQKEDDKTLLVWYMDGATRVSTDWMASTSDPLWRVVATADFNSDAKPDLLWQHDSTAQLIIWYMDGVIHAGTQYTSNQTTVPAWKVVGTGDFNNDGHTDLAWQHNGAGAADFEKVVIWFMNGATFTGGGYAAPAKADESSWKVVTSY